MAHSKVVENYCPKLNIRESWPKCILILCCLKLSLCCAETSPTNFPVVALSKKGRFLTFEKLFSGKLE